MTRERENVSAQLTQAEQVKLVAEGELAEVRHTMIRVINNILVLEPNLNVDSVPYHLYSARCRTTTPAMHGVATGM